MRTVLMVASEAGEFAGVERRCERKERLPWPLDYACAVEVNGERRLLVANGAGAARAAEAVREASRREPPDAMVSTGYCGALDPELGASEVFVASEVRDGGGRYPAQGPHCGAAYRAGTMLAAARVIQSAQEKAALFQESGAGAVDMESGAVGAEAHRAGIPFYCVRVVTDRADETFPVDFNAARDASGRISRAKVVGQALRRPLLRIPRLVRLARRARQASESLGEFLAGCRF